MGEKMFNYDKRFLLSSDMYKFFETFVISMNGYGLWLRWSNYGH